MSGKKGDYIIKWRGRELLHILHEVHKKDCTCSYCAPFNYKRKIHYGLNLPEDRRWNSWRVLKYFNRRYIRWTNAFLKK